MNLCKLKVSHFLAILNLVCLRNVASTTTPSIVATGQTHQSITFRIDDATNPTIAQLSSDSVSGSAFVENTDGTFTLSGLDAGNCYVITYNDGTAYTQTICTYLEVTQLAGATTTTGFTVVISADTGSVESGSASIDGGTTITGTVADPNVNVAFTGLTAGTTYTVDATGTLANPNSNVPANHEWVGKGEFCTVPEPVNAAVVSTAADSFTATGVVLTVTASTTDGANPNSVIAVTPTCGGTAETVQYPDCDGDNDKECELIDLTPGCEYTFAVTMVCAKDEPFTTSSSAVNVIACTIPSTAVVAQTAYTVDPTSIEITTVTADNGVFQDFGIKSVDGTDLNALTKTASDLTAGTCYELGIVLTCGDLEGAVSSHKLCSLFEQSIGSETTASVTLSWPLVDTSLTANGLAVTTYEVVVDGDDVSPQTGTASQDLVVDSLNSPGSKHTVSSKIVLDNAQTLQSTTDEFCLKPDTATTDQSLTVAAVNSVQFTGFGVASGEFSGFEVGLTGCGYTGEDVSVTTSDGIALFDGLHSGCISDVTVTAFCEVDTPLDGAALIFQQCTIPEPVSTAVLSTAPNSVTTTEVVLTVTVPTTTGVNPDSVIVVTPTCNGTAETVQYPTCNGNDDQECELTGLTPGCEYTFAVTMVCAKDEPFTRSSSAVNVIACTKPSTIESLDYDQITITTTSFNILDDHVIPVSGTFESFVIKSVQGGAGTPAISSGLVEGLEAGNCYTLNMALKCGDLEGDATDEVLCTKHELIVGADMPTTDTITFSWPLNDASLTSTTTTVASYKSKVGDNAEVAQQTASGTVVTIASQTPGSVISVSTIFEYSQTQTVTAGPSDFCLKPNPATQDTLVVANESIGFSGLGVTSGEFTGHSGSVTGCNNVSDSSTDATLTFGGLTPACVYDVIIQSYCQPSGAEGTTGQIMSEELTLTQCTKPLQADFSVSEITSTSCTITVAQPTDGKAEYYTFAFKLVAGDPNVFDEFQSTKTFENLTPSSDYTIYATVQYNDPNADAMESDVREVTCRTSDDGCLDIGQGNCHLPEGSADEPKNYRCKAGWSVDAATGLCADVDNIATYSFTFLTKDVAKVFWTAPENFVNVSKTDFFIVRLNGIEVSKLPATSKELELALENLSLCDDYKVSIQPVRNTTLFNAVELTIRTWSDESNVSKILQDYPESIVECGVCPNVNLTKLCVFPFEFNGNIYNSCVPFDGPGSLNCKDGNNLKISCYQASHCLPEAPSLSVLRFETKVAGYSVRLSWDVSSDSFSYFNIFVNGELSFTTKATEVDLKDMTVGENYDIKVEMNAFGRTDIYEIISFIFSDQEQNAFSYNITNTSATVSWEMFATVNTSEDSVLTVECKVDSRDFVHLYLEPEEVHRIERTELEKNTTSLAISGHPGIPVKCVLSLKDGSSNISTVSPLVPNQLSVQNNNLTLFFDEQSGTWKLSGQLTKETGSEKLNFDVSIKNYVVSIVEDGELWLIAKSELNETVLPKIQCSTIDCVSNSNLEFEQSVADLKPVPGSISQVDCYGNTGPFDAESSSLVHVENPNPAEYLDVYFVDETTVKLSWKPPRVGFYIGFKLIHRLHNGTEITKQIKSGYMRHIADQLVPGSPHLIQVLTIADEEGLIVSTPKDIAVDTAPRLPSNLIIQIEDIKLSVSFQRPDFGFYEQFRIDIFEIDDNQEKNLTSQVFLPNTTFDFNVNLEKLATVYEIEVRSISKHGRFNFFPLADFAMTGVGRIEMQLYEIGRSANWFCFVWDAKEDVVKKMDTVTSKIVQDNHLVSTGLFTIANQQLGLNCLDISALNFERSFTVETVMSKTQMSLSVSSAPVEYQIRQPAEKRFELNITTECDSSQCHVHLEDNKLTNRSQFHFLFELFNKPSNESKSGVFRGSDCSDDLDICSYLLEDLNPSTQYEIIVTVHLYQQWIPKTFTHQFSTKADEKTLSLGIVSVIILVALAVPAIIGLGAFIIINKMRRFRFQEPSENHPDDMYRSPDNNETYANQPGSMSSLTLVTNNTMGDFELEQRNIYVDPQQHDVSTYLENNAFEHENCFNSEASVDD